MPEKNHITLLLCLLALSLGFATSSIAEPPVLIGQNENTVEIVFTSVEPEKGNIWVGVCTKDEIKRRYRGDDIVCTAEGWLDATNNARISFEDLAPGTYAITAFHDENGNSKLDFDTRGIPFEATGNGNNAKGSYGPPTFEQMKFELRDYSPSRPKVVYAVNFYRAGPSF